MAPARISSEMEHTSHVPLVGRPLSPHRVVTVHAVTQVAGARADHRLERMPRSPDAVSGALDSLLQRYRESVARVGRRHGLTDQLLDDAMQELRIRLWRAFPGSESARCRERGLPVSGRRHRRADGAATASREGGDGPRGHAAFRGDYAGAPARARRVSGRIRALPMRRPRDRHAALVASGRGATPSQGLSPGGDRELLGWSEATTRNLLYRGLDDLRAVLAKEGIGPGATV